MTNAKLANNCNVVIDCLNCYNFQGSAANRESSRGQRGRARAGDAAAAAEESADVACVQMDSVWEAVISSYAPGKNQLPLCLLFFQSKLHSMGIELHRHV